MKLIKKVRSLSALLVMSAMFAQANSAQAIDKHWDGSSNNRWDNADNWTPAGVPVSGDDVFIDLPGTYNVNYVNNALVNQTINSLTVGGAAGVQTLTIQQNSLTLNAASSVATSGALVLKGTGILIGAGDLTINGAFNFGGGTLGGGSNLTIAPGVIVSVDGTNKTLARNIINDGTINWSAGNIGVAPGTTITNNGTVDLQSDNGLIKSPSGAGVNPVFNNTGTLLKTGGAGLSSFTNVNVTNSGSVALSTGTLNVGSTAGNPANSYTQSAGFTVLNSGTTLGKGAINVNGGTLGGNGTVDGVLTNSGGLIQPGGSAAAGTLTVKSGYVQGAGGTLAIEIGGLSAGSQYDQVVVTNGNGTLGGTLATSLISGFTPDPGNDNACNVADTFLPITYTGRVGTFASVTGPGAPLSFTVTNNSSNVTLTTNTTAPIISGFTPLAGGPGTIVTITGRNFTGATAVTFNGTNANSFTVDSATSITAVAPLGVTSGALVVTNAAGVSGPSCDAFTADATAPTATIDAPANGTSVCDFSAGVSGTATDAGGVSAVSITLRRAKDGKFWNSTSSTWTTTASMIPATLGAGTWSVAAASLPGTGADTGIYNIWAFAFDNAGNLRTTRSNVNINCGIAALTLPAALSGDGSK